MNVAIILSGGVGKRFASDIPKQYMDLCGKPVIEYVLEAALNSKSIDQIVLVMDDKYKSYIKQYENKKVHIVPNGKERLYSIKNGLDFIKENFKSCNNIIILQAVSPFITSKLIDKYINLLNYYDVITTAEKCPGELFNIKNYEKLNRNDFYFCQSPEAFKFKELYECIDTKSIYSELIYHYIEKPKICYYTDFEDNVKLTFKSDLEYAKFLMLNKED